MSILYKWVSLRGQVADIDCCIWDLHAEYVCWHHSGCYYSSQDGEDVRLS